MTQQLDKYLDGFARHLRILQALSAKSVDNYLGKVKEFFLWLEFSPLPPSEGGRGENSSPNPSREGNNNPLIPPLVRGNENPPPTPSPEGVGRQDIERYLEWCYYRGNGNQTRATKLIALKKFFRYLLYEGVIQQDITVQVPRPKVSRRFVQKFTKEEIINFFGAVEMDSEKGLRDVAIFILAAFCGLRVSEIVNLTLNDIIDDGHAIEVNVIDSKHDSSGSVGLWKAPSVFLRQYLLARISHGAKADDPYLISYWKSGEARIQLSDVAGKYRSGRPLTEAAINNLVKKYAKKAGIRKARIYPHMFRATHASDLRHIRGYDIAAIAQRLRHRHIASTDRYLPSRERIHREYNSLAEYWQEFANLWRRRERENAEKVGQGAGSPQPADITAGAAAGIA